MSELKKQIILSDDAEFTADGPGENQQIIQGAIIFDNAEFQPLESDQDITIYPDGITFKLSDLTPLDEFNGLQGRIDFDPDTVEFIPDEPPEKQQLKPAIIIDGPTGRK